MTTQGGHSVVSPQMTTTIQVYYGMDKDILLAYTQTAGKTVTVSQGVVLTSQSAD